MPDLGYWVCRRVWQLSQFKVWLYNPAFSITDILLAFSLSQTTGFLSDTYYRLSLPYRLAAFTLIPSYRFSPRYYWLSLCYRLLVFSLLHTTDFLSDTILAFCKILLNFSPIHTRPTGFPSARYYWLSLLYKLYWLSL